ncbi:MAG: T9SS type A sorting domain-containing protein [Saprospiraceae bacterium]|nr:T9SS type A sorting domain-containing protein [Saprospiraceae bacterium]
MFKTYFLDYLSDKANYTLSTTDASKIYNAGLRKHPLAGFARAIHYTLTSQKVPVTLTHLNGNTQIRAKEPMESSVSIYPNPTAIGIFNVDIAKYNDGDHVICTVYNIYGQQIHTQKINQKITLVEIPNANNALYLVQIFVNKINIQTAKLIVK